MEMYLGIDFRLLLVLLYMVLLANAREEAIEEDANAQSLTEEKTEKGNLDYSNVNILDEKQKSEKGTSESEKVPSDISDALKETIRIHRDTIHPDSTNDIDFNAESMNFEKDDNFSKEKTNLEKEEGNPIKEETEPIKEEAEPIKEETEPIKENTKHIKEETEPIKEEAEPIKEETEPIEEETEPIEEETEPIKEGTEPIKETDEDIVEDAFRPLEINQVRVVQDNISGHKGSSFSEDKSENRGDEITVSQLKEEAENRILEKEMNHEDTDDEGSGDDGGMDGDDISIKDVKGDVNLLMEPDIIHEDVIDGGERSESGESNGIESEGENEKSAGSGNEKNIEIADENENSYGSPDSNGVDGQDEKTEENKVQVIADENIKEIDEPIDSFAEKAEEKSEEILYKKNLILKGKWDDGEIPERFLSEDKSNIDKFLSKEEVSSSDKKSNVAKNKVNTDKEFVKESTSKSDDAVNIQKNTQQAKENVINKLLVKEAVKNEENKNKRKPVAEKEVKEQPGAAVYEEAMNLLKVGKKDVKKAYKLLAEAAELNNTDASEKIVYPYMFGDDIRRNKTKAVQLFHTLAEQGIPLGQQGLGFIYGAGLNVNSSQAKALIYTTFAALGGDAMAQMMLGYRYFNGIGVAKNCESALTHYKKVAKKVTDETTSHGGNAVQRIRLYDELEQPGGTSGQIDEDLLQYYQFLADKGDLQAQVGLGQLYFQGGRGIDVNYEKAFKYFQLAGDVDNGNGLAYLGKMYLDGLHVEKDLQKAFEYFTKAAEQSNPIGQAGLGMIYLKGSGVKKDYDQAMKYFSQAAEQGWMEGQLQLGNMYYNGIGVKKDYRQAVKYFTFASQSGHVMAFYNLASMHATGAGVMRSCNTATELFKNVAERGKWSMMFMDAYDSYRAGDLETALVKYYYLAELGYEVAQSNVAYILEKGEMTWFSQNQTYARSLLQWSRAAHQGYAVARVKVGDYHFYGFGTKVDYDTAALHYRMASDQQNNPQAMFNLGYMHEQGFGLKEDIHLAKRFYDMAAEASPDAHFPVTLALLKLTCYFTWEWLQKNYRFWEYAPFEQWWLYLLQKLGPDWDMYLITALAILLGGILLFRRNLRR